MSQEASMESATAETSRETPAAAAAADSSTDQKQRKTKQYIQKHESSSSHKSNTSNENEPNLENPPQQNQNQNQDQDQENNKDADSSSPNNDDRPPPGSEEWHRQRRESHKLVERRRRETINEGISVLGRLVPNCEKNKGQILQRAAEYIQHLKRLDAANAEKWTLEKLLLNQALDQLHGQVQDLKSQLEAVQRENDLLKEQLNHRERDSVSLKRDHDQEDDEKSRKSLKKEA